MLTISTAYLQQIRQQGENIYPEECCGLLLGTIEKNQGIVTEIYPTPNSWPPEDQSLLGDNSDKKLSRCNRFSIDPKILLQVQKEARNRELNIIGVYHSHPDYSAIPSQFDKAIAWPDYYYIIVSIQQGKAQDLFAWKLDEQHQFESITINN
jgi:proteasome lid subunit RPN8/RPN11